MTVVKFVKGSFLVRPSVLKLFNAEDAESAEGVGATDFSANGRAALRAGGLAPDATRRACPATRPFSSW
jgi:hypothetical protein